MPISLYDAFVPSCLQILDSVSGLIDKAQTHCDERGNAAEELIEARLFEDMLPFAYQVKSCAVHSIGAIEGVRLGNFSPDRSQPPRTFDGLRTLVDDTISHLKCLDSEDVEALAGKEMHFTVGDQIDWPFKGVNFLLSFSQPNFYFHATTAYDILRMKGVSIGKLDYLGQLRIST